MRRIRDYMTTAPITIEHSRSVAEALELMEENGIHHLLVVDGGRLIGVLSERDLYRLESHKRVDPEVMSVAQAMTPEPYTTEGDTPLSQVLPEMAAHHYGSALVVEGDKVLGLFTGTDALLLLARLVAADDAMAEAPTDKLDH